MSQPWRSTAAEEVALIRRIEDQAVLDLIRDTLEKLNVLGDRLEVFASGGDSKGKEKP